MGSSGNLAGNEHTFGKTIFLSPFGKGGGKGGF